MQYTFTADVGPFADTGIFIKADGTRALSGDWDIGAGRMIQGEKIQARSNLGLALYEDGGSGIFVKDGGNVGIGTVDPNSNFHLVGEHSVAVGDKRFLRLEAAISGNQSSGYSHNSGVYAEIINDATESGTGIVSVSSFNARVRNLGKAHYLQGIFGVCYHESANILNSMQGMGGVAGPVGGGTVNVAYGVSTILGAYYADSLIIKAYGLHCTTDVQLGGAITNYYGLYITGINAANKWGVYVNDDIDNYFAGRVGVGISPLAKLHVNSPAGLDAIKIATGQGGDISIDEWGNLNFKHNGLGARYDNNLSQVSFNNTHDLYISSGWNSASPFNILFMPSSTGKIGLASGY
jgi:hypothetical protein